MPWWLTINLSQIKYRKRNSFLRILDSRDLLVLTCVIRPGNGDNFKTVKSAGKREGNTNINTKASIKFVINP